jgi:hypothetical protein
MICSPCRTGGEVNSEAVAYLNDGDLAGYENRKVIAQSFHAKCSGCTCQHHVGARLLLSEQPKVDQTHAVDLGNG